MLTILLKAANRLRDRKLYTTNIILRAQTVKGHLKKAIKVELSADSIPLAKALLAGWDELNRKQSRYNKT